MAKRRKTLPVLEGAQATAVGSERPCHAVGIGGHGQDAVLTGRVLRLLLSGAAPETILCLTFTKAGAAEMANRIGAQLAAWVRMPEADLKKDLFALGERDDPASRQRARRLFAKVLDAPGGLRIQTIHSFAQALLAAFRQKRGSRPVSAQSRAGPSRNWRARHSPILLADAEASGDRSADRATSSASACASGKTARSSI